MRLDDTASPSTPLLRAVARCAIALAFFFLPPLGAEPTPNESIVVGLIHRQAYDDLRRLGHGVLPVMARLYEKGGLALRKELATAFYTLAWESPEAKRALIRDLASSDSDLRIAVQYALGRVSGDDDVVDRLLQAMRTDPSPLIRDKAACALTYDQPHLGRAGLARLYTGLIAALEDEDPQIRSVAILALEIRTGQTKRFIPSAPLISRTPAVEAWQKWLAEYKAQL